HVVVAADGQRRAALAADQVELLLQLGGRAATLLRDEADDRVAGALAVLVAVAVDPAPPGFGPEGDETGLVRAPLALADPPARWRGRRSSAPPGSRRPARPAAPPRPARPPRSPASG